MEKEKYGTPNQRRRLGLRRSSSIVSSNGDKISVGSISKSKTTAVNNIASTPCTRQPQSDAKINYKNLERNLSKEGVLRKANSPDTPNSANVISLQRMAISSGYRPYRLSLSKKVRDRISKRRLEFHLANEMQTVSNEETETSDNKPLQSRKELLQQIDIARKELASKQEHCRKVKELKEAIAIWKDGFSSAVHDLQQKVEPRLQIAQLLEYLHIPEEMLKYVND